MAYERDAVAPRGLGNALSRNLTTCQIMRVKRTSNVWRECIRMVWIRQESSVVAITKAHKHLDGVCMIRHSSYSLPASRKEPNEYHGIHPASRPSVHAEAIPRIASSAAECISAAKFAEKCRPTASGLVIS
jgi:hypothetical protein